MHQKNLTFSWPKLYENVKHQFVVTNALPRFCIVTHSYTALFSIKSILYETKTIFYNQVNQNWDETNKDSESTSKVKLWSHWTVFEILLMSVVICIYRFLYGNEIMQYLEFYANAIKFIKTIWKLIKVLQGTNKLVSLKRPIYFVKSIDFWATFDIQIDITLAVF